MKLEDERIGMSSLSTAREGSLQWRLLGIVDVCEDEGTSILMRRPESRNVGTKNETMSEYKSSFTSHNQRREAE